MLDDFVYNGRPLALFIIGVLVIAAVFAVIVYLLDSIKH